MATPFDPTSTTTPPGGGSTPVDPTAAAIAALIGAGSGVNTPGWYLALTPDQQQAVARAFEQQYARKFSPDDPLLQTQAVANQLLGSASFQENANSAADRLGIPAGPFTQRPSGAPGQTQRTSTLDQVQSATKAQARSAPYMSELVSAADQAGVPWQVAWSVINGESGWDETAVGDNGQSHGLGQIYGPANPGVTVAEANDPHYAIQYLVHRLSAAYNKYRDWSLAVLSYNSPAAADSLFNTGQHMPGRDLIDVQYLTRTLGSLPDGTGFDPKTDTKMSVIPGVSGSGSNAGSAITLPDPVAMRSYAKDYLKGLFYRDPTDQELDGLVGMVQGAMLTSAQQKNAQPNPFNPDPSLQRPTSDITMINPVPGAKQTGTFGEDRGGHVHQGVDLAVPVGSPVLAPVAGFVTYDTTSDPGGYGNMMVLKGDDGRTYLFGHLSDSVAQSGTHVTAGTQIAKSGGAAGAPGAGDSSGPHVHFEIRQDGGPGPQGQINPEPALSGATQLATEQEAQSGALAAAGTGTTTAIDWQSRIQEQLRNSPEYQQLYGAKPTGQSEAGYSNQFVSVGQGLLGVAPPDEAVRLGMETNSPSTTAGYVAGTPGATQNPTFRQQLFKKAALMSELA